MWSLRAYISSWIIACIIIFTTTVAGSQQPPPPPPPLPYPVADGWTYFLEAVRAKAWPSCQVRFLSCNAPSGCSLMNMWDGLKITNQRFKLAAPTIATSTKNNTKKNSTNVFSLLATNSDEQHYHRLVYSVSNCSDTTLSLQRVENLPHHGVSDAFEFRPSIVGNNEKDEEDENQGGTYSVIATDRERSCPGKSAVLSFPRRCGSNLGPEGVFIGGSLDEKENNNKNGSQDLWRAVPAQPPDLKNVTPAVGFDHYCADPFWWREAGGKIFLTCTGGDINLYSTLWPANETVNHTILFSHNGMALGGSPKPWCKENQRWAAESYSSSSNNIVTLILCDAQPSGPHRIGYAISHRGTGPSHFDRYSPSFLKLSPGDAGDIDPHIFVDPTNSKQYIVWKQDENRIGSLTTRIWAQEITIDEASGVLVQQGQPRVVLDSCCLWWIEGFLGPDSSLVEGPEVVYRRGWYYLFFAAGRYKDYSYTEGVARSRSIWGPFVKRGVPVINTGMVGLLRGKQLLGPGHAGFMYDEKKDVLHAIFHAHVDGSMRTVFVTELVFDKEEWPVALMRGNF